MSGDTFGLFQIYSKDGLHQTLVGQQLIDNNATVTNFPAWAAATFVNFTTP